MKAYSLDFRQKIVDCYEKGGISQRQLAERFCVAPSFIIKLLKQYKQTGDLSPKPRPGRPRKLNAEHQQTVQEWIEEQPDLLLSEVSERLTQQFSLEVSESTLSRTMNRLGLSRKKKSLYPSQKASPRVQAQRVAYWDEVREIKAEDLVFIDECGVNLGMIRLFAWALRGSRAYGEQPKRGQNVSVVGGLSLTGLVGSAAILGAYDGLTFEAYVATRLVPNLWPGACVMMDNCSIHKGEEVRHLIEAAGARLIYLPPYSPDFSPIENFWSKFKNSLKNLGARSYQALNEAIETAFSEISKADIHSWFTHCCYCTS